ncbi:phosphotransferase enzyme family protein, partial [Corynebacterium sp.]|uniref:phosphotransferase enzyme family protein n=1 Tax=Corynebacterium sp. TaxID=1720 RepID=UPI0026E0FD73
MTPHEHLLAYADLEHAELLIDAPSLSTLLNREVELIHRRIKPGHSVLVAWRCRSSGECGWAEVTSSPDKVANTLRRAARYGLEVTVHREGVLSGLVWSDRKLVRALDGLPRTGLRILRYNPHRRLVAATSDGLVVRVHADDASHLGRTAARWQSAGVRTLSAVGGGQVSVSPWWGHGDLGAVPSAAAARSAGEEVARLHRLSMPPGPVRSPEIDTTAATLAPWTAEAVHSLAARLAVLLPATEGETCALHGDLSPDQILVGEDGQIRLIDLDRATTGPAARDVGSFLAACDPDLAGDFLAGYRAAGGRVDQAHVAAWEALAHLNYGLAPLRGGAEDWVAPLERSLAAAHRALDLLPPATVEVDGRAWAVTRAWPGQELSVELRDPDSGAIRAGRWTRHEVVAEAPGTDPRLDLPAGEVVSHRRGKRAVVRSSDGQRYTKVVRAGKATGILAGIDRARP